MSLDREKIFNEDPKPDYLWCTHCERAYKYGEFRLLKGLQMCPYPDCDGDTVMDAHDWDGLREINKEYPKIPLKDVVYPEYPESD